MNERFSIVRLTEAQAAQITPLLDTEGAVFGEIRTANEPGQPSALYLFAGQLSDKAAKKIRTTLEADAPFPKPEKPPTPASKPTDPALVP